jgi:hypothetical protein
MSWFSNDDPPITGRILGLPSVLVVALWLVLMFVTIWTLDNCDKRQLPRETFTVYVFPIGETWSVVPAGRDTPRHPLLDQLGSTDAIRCVIEAEYSEVLGTKTSAMVYRGSATLAIEPLGGRYTAEFCELVVDSLRPQLASQAAITWPGRALAPLIRNAGQPCNVVVWTGVAADVLLFVTLIGAAVLAMYGRRKTV